MYKNIQSLVTSAFQQRASDIYVLPDNGGYRIGFFTKNGITWHDNISRIDGEHLIRYLKYRGGLDLSDGRRPQDGRIKFEIEGQVIFGRISCVGDYQWREMLVLRLIYEISTDWFRWGNQQALCDLGQTLPESNGLVLFAGKMGSGKTTTMHYLLQTYLSNKLVLTIEDPVEIVQSTFMQLEVNDLAGMTYEQLLRVALRHHPEVLVIGEIRDTATANCAVKAALSGHLVMATIHAKSDKDVHARLLSLDVDEQLATQALCATVLTRKEINNTVSVEVASC